MGVKKVRVLLLCFIAVIVLMACGAKNAGGRENDNQEDVSTGGWQEIKIVRTITPEPIEKIDFDLENLAIVGRDTDERLDRKTESGTDGTDGLPQDSRADDTDSSGSEEAVIGSDGYTDGDSEGDAESEDGAESGNYIPEYGESGDSTIGEGWMDNEDESESEGDSIEPERTDGEDGNGYESESGDTDNTVLNDWVYYANCRITHYDTGACCCGAYATGYTASGTLATVGRTVATGWDIPFGTEVMINGQIYIAEDRGVDPYQIDILVSDHETALAMGMYYTDVYVRYVE